MKLSIKALTLTAAIVWSAAILMIAGTNLFYPDYGLGFLEMLASIYPGYHPGSGAGSIITGSLYGFVDASICAAVFAGLYNFFVD